MEQISVMGGTGNTLTGKRPDHRDFLSGLKGKDPAIESLLSEGGDDFFQYLTWIGLAKEPNLMVISSNHHYYYDHNDLRGIKTLINLKKLNHVRHLESFLNTLCRILPPKASFVGCFKNSGNTANGIQFQNPARLMNGVMNIFDSKPERVLSKKGVTKLLEDHKFKVNDITDINGITYFWAQNTAKNTD